jgi:hypothetical protein
MAAAARAKAGPPASRLRGRTDPPPGVVAAPPPATADSARAPPACRISGCARARRLAAASAARMVGDRGRGGGRRVLSRQGGPGWAGFGGAASICSAAAAVRVLWEGAGGRTRPGARARAIKLRRPRRMGISLGPHRARRNCWWPPIPKHPPDTASAPAMAITQRAGAPRAAQRPCAPTARRVAAVAPRGTAGRRAVAVRASVVVGAAPARGGRARGARDRAPARAAPAGGAAAPGRPLPAHACRRCRPALQEPPATVLVAGSTGGVGQIVTGKLLEVGGAFGGGEMRMRRPHGASAHPAPMRARPARTPRQSALVPAFSPPLGSPRGSASIPTPPLNAPPLAPLRPRPPQRGYKVRALTRRAARARELFGDHPNLEVGAGAGEQSPPGG